MKTGDGKWVGHRPLSTPKVDGQRVEDPTWAQRFANGGWLPIKVKRGNEGLRPRAQSMEVVTNEMSSPSLLGHGPSRTSLREWSRPMPDTRPDPVQLANRLSEVGPRTSSLERILVVEDALLYLADLSVDFEAKARIVTGLSANAHLKLREMDDAGRAPNVLRKHARPLLAVFSAELQRLDEVNEQPRTQHWDALVLPLLVEAQNARTNGLHATIRGPESLARALAQDAGAAHERIGILETSGHFAAFHYLTQPGKPPRLCVIDSYEDPSNAVKRIAGHTGCPVNAVPVLLKTQNATECAVYALATGKKIHANLDSVNALYDGQPGVRALVKGWEQLPVDFFKQTQSLRPLHSLENAQQLSLDGVPVNKGGEDAYERFDRHTVYRDQLSQYGTTQTVNYSASIEAKRRTFVQQAIVHFGGTAV